MSHLTASPFRKPSPYEFPRGIHPLSPPDTDSEVGAPAQSVPPSGATSVMFGVEFDQTANQPLQAESPAARFRRVSTLAYHPSGLRDPPARERSASRASKAVVVVIPPGSLAQQHGQLSSGPQSRLAQGILLPLLPSLSAQLTAIAREFSFPSTAGLCLYLSVTDSGITFTPRITDESWQIIWSHALEGGTSPSTGSHGLPIVGKIEFDVDTRKARWYAAWITASLRDPVDNDTRSSISHWRGDSRTTFADDQMADDLSERPPVTQLKQPHRHVPRKLSLVDRFDLSSSRTSASQAAVEVQTVPVLSPIVQVDEPHTAKKKLESKVKNWRASASLASTPLPAILGVEESHGLASEFKEEEKELNLDDFSWSVTSAGPPSNAIDTPTSQYRLPSVHLDRRMMDSVSLTPTTCTSWGPLDYDIDSPTTDVSLVRTPDIGQRMIESSPPTPSTATTWGPPLSWPVTPFSAARPRSIHLGDRMQYSRPVTPSTATTWGAPLTYPPSPATPFYVNTPDAGQRAFDEDEEECFPTSITTAASISEYPYLTIYPDVCSQLGLFPAGAERRNLTARGAINTKLQAVYPFFHIYPDAYPHIGIYPDISLDSRLRAIKRKTWTLEEKALPIALSSLYPTFDIYPAIYPDLKIYPDIARIEPSLTGHTMEIVSSHPSGYPHFDIYPAVRDVSVSLVRNSLAVFLEACYPSFNLYRPVYPSFDLYPPAHPVGDIYPSKLELSVSNRPRVSLSDSPHFYPHICVYPAVYPCFDLYPPVKNDALRSVFGASVLNAPPQSQVSIRHGAYPFFDLYPALSKQPVTGVSGKLEVLYPAFNIYPAVYPHFDLYNKGSTQNANDPHRSSNELPAKYPAMVLYAPVYPHFDIYPGWCQSADTRVSSDVPHTPLLRRASNELPARYPTITLYAPVYPYFDLYPGWCRSIDARVTLDIAHAPFRSIRKASRAHKQLHDEVFANAEVSSPSGMPDVYPPSTTEPAGSQPSIGLRARRSRSGTISSRPEMPSVVKTLPALPSSLVEQFSSPQANAPRRSPSTTSGLPLRPSLLRPSSSLRVSDIQASSTISYTRPISTTFPSKPLFEEPHSVDKEDPLPSRLPARRRDSSVLQRARAYDAQPAAQANSRRTEIAHTLSLFPMPPAPPVPTMPIRRSASFPAPRAF